jgi:hypothetical protein
VLGLGVGLDPELALGPQLLLALAALGGLGLSLCAALRHLGL